jgi:hypothetical protein
VNVLKISIAAAFALSITSAFAAEIAGLKTGEYACYGSGGRILMGFGFKVAPGNRYNDLDSQIAQHVLDHGKRGRLPGRSPGRTDRKRFEKRPLPSRTDGLVRAVLTVRTRAVRTAGTRGEGQ